MSEQIDKEAPAYEEEQNNVEDSCKITYDVNNCEASQQVAEVAQNEREKPVVTKEFLSQGHTNIAFEENTCNIPAQNNISMSIPDNPHLKGDAEQGMAGMRQENNITVAIPVSNVDPNDKTNFNNRDEPSPENNKRGLSDNYLISESNVVRRFSPKWNQFIAAMGPLLMIFSAGLSSGYSATLLPALHKENSPILIDKDSPSWIASLAALPMSPGGFIGGWLMERFGRRHSLRILSVPFFVGWAIIASSQNLTLMLIGRFLNGLSIGLLAPSMSVFISECSSPDIRGVFLAFLSLFLAIGIFISHIIGTWMSWQWTAVICMLFPLSSGFLISFVPESPVWLISKGKTELGAKSFYWLRGYDDAVKTELKAIIDRFDTSQTTANLTWKQKLINYNTPEFFRPLSIMIVIYLTCQYSGVHAITFYSVDIIEKAVGEGIDRYAAMLTIDSVRVMITLVTCLSSRRFPRRTLCITSGCLTTISMLGLSLFLYYHNENIPTHLTAIPLCFLTLYIIAVNIGLMPLPWIIVGEIFPTRFRSLGAGLASAVGNASIFVVVKTTPAMMSNLGQVSTFIFYGSVAMVGTAILFFILPETKDKSLLEIEAIFKKKNENK